MIGAMTTKSFSQTIVKYEPAILECYYHIKIIEDTLDRENNFSTENMNLRIGKNISMYYCPERMHWDSIQAYNDNAFELLIKEIDRTGFPPGGSFMKIYKNYPPGKLTHYNHSSMDFVYEEEWEKQDWNYMDSIKIILDYTCHLAKANYRGRTWYAWFTMDIPVSDGPWKLCGTPGLIMEAYDENKDYYYILTGIKKQGVSDVGLYNYRERDYAKTTRKSLLKLKNHSRKTDPRMVINAKLGVDLDTSKKLRQMNYDSEERDY